MQMTPPRDPVTGQLVANTTRFPSGMQALGDYMHARGIQFGLYTSESPTTCAQYPASAGYEQLDADTFASWGVDYLKVDGCTYNHSFYPVGYPKMGSALQSTGRNITYSCSWPAYISDDETIKPWDAIIDAGCWLWRNWHDMGCSWDDSLAQIIEHWGTYGQFLSTIAGGGHWNDADMLLIGNDCITDDEARTQMAIWSIIASPLIMGNDLRNITDSAKAILLNKEAIAVNQDPLFQAGYRITPSNNTEVWARNLTSNAVAVALFNKLGDPNAPSSNGTAADITVQFTQVGFAANATVLVRDIWEQANIGSFVGNYTARQVPFHGTAFLRLSQI